jgi:hypothetical protein
MDYIIGNKQCHIYLQHAGIEYLPLRKKTMPEVMGHGLNTVPKGYNINTT